MIYFGINLCKTLEQFWKVLLTRLQWTNTGSVISDWGTFLPFLSFAIFCSLLPNNFIVSGGKSAKKIDGFIWM